MFPGLTQSQVSINGQSTSMDIPAASRKSGHTDAEESFAALDGRPFGAALGLGADPAVKKPGDASHLPDELLYTVKVGTER